MVKVRKYMDVHGGSIRDPKYFSARAIVDYRPLEALLVQEGLINNHPFITVF